MTTEVAPHLVDALTVDGLSKSFGATQALAHFSLQVAPGEIHGLVGGNGSGKSTLIKILAGIGRPDQGTVSVRGEVLLDGGKSDPESVRRAGLRFVHQQTSVFPGLSVAENLGLGADFPRRRTGTIDWRAQRAIATEILDRFGIEARPEEVVDRLRPASRAMLVIARSLHDLAGERRGILVLDEPTASLPATEARLLLTAIKRYAADGHSILFVSHRLDEILEATHRVTVIKDGRLVATRPTGELDHTSLGELIAGRRLLTGRSERAHGGELGEAPPRLVVSDLAGGALRHASFSVARGEIVGIDGLLGSGRTSLLRLLFGLIPRTSGTVTLDGVEVQPRDVSAAMKAGFALVPEDRATESVFPDLDLAANLSLASLDLYWRRGHVATRAERRDTATLIKDYGIKAESATTRMSALSGGNQQKAVIARWLRRKPSVVLLDEPTHGVDVGARADIYAMVRGIAAQGSAVIVVSSDTDELQQLCDRFLVMREGVLDGPSSHDAELSRPSERCATP